MNSVLTTGQDFNRTQKPSTSNNDIETTGTLAMADYSAPIFSMPVANYDMFIPTNPFSLNIDFGSYAEQESNTLADNSSFMQGFFNAMSVLTSRGFGGGDYGGASVTSSAGAGGSVGSCSVGGGFTSVG